MIATKDIRIEKDFLGKKKYQVQLIMVYKHYVRRKLPNYRIPHSSITHYSNGNCEKAAALANIDTGYLAKDIGHEIAEAAQEIVDGKFHDQFIVDPIQGGAGTSINMNTNEVIANRALERMGYEKGNMRKLAQTLM